MNTPGFVRYYDETVDALLAQRHEVLLGFTDTRLRAEALEMLAPRSPGRLHPHPSSLPEQLEQVNASLVGATRDGNDAFLGAFIRPKGLDETATPRMVQEVESLRVIALAKRARIVDAALQLLLLPIARRTAGPSFRRPKHGLLAKAKAPKSRKTPKARNQEKTQKIRAKTRKRRRQMVRRTIGRVRRRVTALVGRRAA